MDLAEVSFRLAILDEAQAIKNPGARQTRAAKQIDAKARIALTGTPVENRYGLRPAVVKGTNKIAPLTTMKDLDTRGWLDGVTTFNFHPHLPHYALTTEDNSAIHVLARQPIDLSRPHPFTEAGNREFNSLVWLPPSGERAGDVLVADSTIFSTLFGGTESLKRFWSNLARAH